ncbi:winged helix-turn-helix domain-containing protein [Angustibacter luteus]|uniref:Winged helix-turn-helix domain-containing protein n=1 Tax=Angustibacter luteus TaxID=658456 RepID=A0ABW1JCM4_9ACTN
MPESREPQPVRVLSGAQTLRALAHPVRLKLLELVSLRGPLTASQCAALVGESPSSCSFHLRQLAKYGYVEEAPGGTGRNRPWQMTSVSHQWSPAQDSDVAARAAGAALSERFRERTAELHREYAEVAAAFGPQWTEAALDLTGNAYLTVAELAEIQADLLAVMSRYLDRITDPSQRPAGARLVHLAALGFPRADGLEPGMDDSDA